jgi:uncharacterized damage-inducible protein DinB
MDASAQPLEGLYASNAWVMEQMLEASRRLPPEQLTGSRQGSYGSVLETLAHIVGALEAWSSRLEGTSPSGLRGASEMPTLDDVQAAFRRASAAFRARVAALTPEAAAQEVSYRTTAGVAERNRLGDLLLHVGVHTSNHLAQVATLLTQAGVTPPEVDYIAWLRAGRPAPTGAA